MWKLVTALLLVVSVPVSVAAGEPRPVDCPAGLPDGARCRAGQDRNGAWYALAEPPLPNGLLVIYAHGGPHLDDPAETDPLRDMKRFAALVAEGYAWAGTDYRRGGFGVRMAAEDVANLADLAQSVTGRSTRTILHGESWGGNVAAKAAELHSVRGDGSRRFDGVILTSGLLQGGPDSYEFRASLRAVYQYYCGNHPRPDETNYPLWQGLPKDAPPMARDELAVRVEECTALSKSSDQRTDSERQRLADIVVATGVSEDVLIPQLLFATNTFADIVQRRLGGRNPFTNADTTYHGSSDDVALNRDITRFRADPEAARALRYDSGLTGQILVPMITQHGIDDPTVFVQLETAYRQMVDAAGNGDLLVQTFTRERSHATLSASQQMALFGAMRLWIETGDRPTPTGIADSCEAAATRLNGVNCYFDAAYEFDAQAIR